MFENLRNPKYIEKIKKEEAYQPLVNALKGYYEDNKLEVVPNLTFDARWEYYNSGDRAIFENIYFARRRFLSGVAIMAVLYPENKQYISELQNILWAICDEYAWAAPAHSTGVFEEDIERTDLFSSETGKTVAEICDLLKDRLHPVVVKRCEYELRRRIIEPYKNKTQFWEKGISNWSAVCASGTASVFYFLEPELFEEYIPRFKISVEYFMKSFADDGTCIEGPSYWNYGFGCFLWLAEAIYDFTGGKEDLLKNEKIQKMAGYMHRSFLKGNCSVSFSDSTANSKIGLATLYYLNKRIPEYVPLLPKEKIAFVSPNIHWGALARALEYYDPELVLPVDIDNCDYYLEKAGQVILNREKYSFAIKTGSNKEPHNQNDVGTFIFSDSSGQVFCDLGPGKYTKQYFDDNYRYNILCCSSLGHNVPIVNGQAQKTGEECRGSISFENGIIKVEFSSAYKIENLNKLLRTVTPTDSGVVVRDEFDNASSFVSRLVTLTEPIVANGAVTVGNTVVEYDSENCGVNVSVDYHEKHKSEESLPVYLIDFSKQGNNNYVELKIQTR